jgi:shikimate kinase
MADRSTRGLALVGYRGTGKSTVGRIVADRLGRPFADADAELERRVGRPISAFFGEEGEAAFRDREEEVLRDLTARPGSVLSTGGGAIIREANRLALRRFGFVAWLTAEPAVLSGRLARDPGGRPGLTPAGPLAEIAAVLAARTPLYREVADAIIETADRTPDEVAGAVLEAWSRGDFDRDLTRAAGGSAS